jgi:hypothetical protein
VLRALQESVVRLGSARKGVLAALCPRLSRRKETFGPGSLVVSWTRLCSEGLFIFLSAAGLLASGRYRGSGAWWPAHL